MGVEGTREKAVEAYNELVEKLGLVLAPKKCTPPNNIITWMGFQIDVVAMTVTIPEVKLKEVLDECKTGMSKKSSL